MEVPMLLDAMVIATVMAFIYVLVDKRA